jgi:hypothetical protein
MSGTAIKWLPKWWEGSSFELAGWLFWNLQVLELLQRRLKPVLYMLK